MKRRTLWSRSPALLGLLLCSMTGAMAQGPSDMNCYLGLKYQLSYQDNWGSNKAVVVTVEPNSPAARAGLRLGDIIETIEGQNTAEISEEQINSLLLRPSATQARLTVSNFGYKSKPLTINKMCRPTDALGERALAEAFAMYSVEDVSHRRFNVPFTFSVTNTHKDFFKYKTFSMYPISGGGYSAMDEVINKHIIDALTQKGLKYQANGGDLLIKTSYSFDKNPVYRGEVKKDDAFRNYRLDGTDGVMKHFPFASMSSQDFVGQYKLDFGIELIDGKDKTTVWSVKANERMFEPYKIEEYARAFVPLMFANFPFQRYLKNPAYVVHSKRYIYTGVYYDSKDLKKVYFVDPNSPAASAGVRAGDVIEAINGVKTVSSADELTKAYKDFITDSFKLRDESTIFVDDNGFARNMYWRKDAYVQVQELLHKKQSKAVFAYLFGNKPYIANPPITDVVFDIKRGGEKLTILVKGEVVNDSFYELK